MYACVLGCSCMCVIIINWNYKQQKINLKVKNTCILFFFQTSHELKCFVIVNLKKSNCKIKNKEMKIHVNFSKTIWHSTKYKIACCFLSEHLPVFFFLRQIIVLYSKENLFWKCYLFWYFIQITDCRQTSALFLLLIWKCK